MEGGLAFLAQPLDGQVFGVNTSLKEAQQHPLSLAWNDDRSGCAGARKEATRASGRLVW